jgi:hypothetical protein
LNGVAGARLAPNIEINCPGATLVSCALSAGSVNHATRALEAKSTKATLPFAPETTALPSARATTGHPLRYTGRLLFVQPT